MHVGVSAIGCKTVRVLPLLGIHEDTIGNMRVVDIGRINTTCVGAVVEGTMVDDNRSFQRRNVTTRINVNEPSGTVGAAVEGTVGDGDVLTCVSALSI